MKRRCDREWEIEALREGRLGERDARAFERHASTCEVCAATVARVARLRRLASEMSAPEPKELELRRARARVLREASTGTSRDPRRGARHVLAASLLAAIGILFWLRVRPTPAPPVPLAFAPIASPALSPQSSPEVASIAFASEVLRDDGARWSRARDGDVERIRLLEGRLRIRVRHQRKEERFLVDLPDGELEVRGTTFDVTANARATERVAVEEGIVALRIRDSSGEIVLTAGHAWAAPQATAQPSAPAPALDTPRPTKSVAALSVEPARAAAPPATNASPRPEAGTTEDDGTEAYTAAVALYQGGRYAEAAVGFRAFGLAHPTASQLEDASFLEAASLARTGRSDAAGLAAEGHLARFPRSFHRREAAILVARAARDRGDCAQAELILAPWTESDEEARRTVEECLAKRAGTK